MATVFKCSCCDYISTVEIQVVWHINAKCTEGTVIKETPNQRQTKEDTKERDFKSTRSVRIFSK